MPYEELPHTADWSLHVWAANLTGLFEEAARGMNALAGAQPAPGPITDRTFESAAPDPESLLVAFLSELVYATEQERLVFENFKIKIEGPALSLSKGLSLIVEMVGAPLVSMNKAIKAITYHNLQIQHTERGYEVEIVFDV